MVIKLILTSYYTFDPYNQTFKSWLLIHILILLDYSRWQSSFRFLVIVLNLYGFFGKQIVGGQVRSLNSFCIIIVKLF